MEVGVRVECERPKRRTRHHTASAYLTFVALDEEGHKAKLPTLMMATADERRRHAQAVSRRELRLRARVSSAGS